MTERARIVRSLAKTSAVVLLVVGMSEVLARITVDRIPRWYGGAEAIAAQEHVDVIFVGSSHVQAAIPTSVFADAVAHETGVRPVALNLARGYTTSIEHYFGLRNVIEAHQEHLRGVTVFIEAPGGMSLMRRWTDAWVNIEQYELLVDLLRPSDIPRLWREAAESSSVKAAVTARYLARHVALLNRRERIRDTLLNELLPRMLGTAPPTGAWVAELGADLRGPELATSIRADEAAVREARAFARTFAAELASVRTPIAAWPDPVTRDLLQLLHRVDGHLVFFVPPESEVFRAGYRSSVHRQNAALFSGEMRRWNACLLQPEFRYSDEDLPDLWHLRRERAPEFARALAHDWVSNCRASDSQVDESGRTISHAR